MKMQRVVLVCALAKCRHRVGDGACDRRAGGWTGEGPHETAFERVMRTGTLRCGYAVATPWFMG